MSNSFKTYYIRDIGKVSMCKRVLKEETFEDEEIPFYKISTFGGKADTFISRKHYQEYRDKYSFPKVGEILISAAGTIGKTVIYNGEDGYFQDSNIVWVENDETKVRNDYLYYFFQTKPWFTTHGSTITRIYNDNLRSIKLNVPDSLFEQQKIASVLSALDSKIELNNRINAELEAMAKTLYDYWFVQFDFPFDFAQGKPNANGKPYKSSGGKMVWNEELKREIPEGWEVKKIGKILKTSLGGTPSTKVKEYWENGKISWLNSGEIANFPIIDSELKITEAAIKNSATNLLPKGSVMLSITRHLRPSILGIDACANQSVVGIFEKGDIKCYFLYPYLQNEIPRLMEMRSGAQQPHINKEIVDESFILLPNDETDILKNYNTKISHFYDSIINKAFQNQKLTELRDWLLPMLMNGQVKVMGEMENELSMAAEPKIEYGK
jgi:type I restriction enzyme S subunit